jgi:hypothetical protein
MRNIRGWAASRCVGLSACCAALPPSAGFHPTRPTASKREVRKVGQIFTTEALRHEEIQEDSYPLRSLVSL